MAGMTAVEKMKAGNIAAKQCTSVLMVPIGDIFAPPASSPIHHPRCNEPLDEEMVVSIVTDGVREEIIVRDDGTHAGKKRLTLVDGARRRSHALEAQRRMHADGTLAADKALYVKVRYFVGSDAELLLARLGFNSDPMKKPDSPAVLSATFVQLTNLGCDLADIAKVAPRGIGKGEIVALLSWGNLLAEEQVKFNEGAPIGLLAAVLDAPRESQMEKLEELQSAGIKTQKGVTRAQNRQKREDAAHGGTVSTEKVRPETLKKVVEAARPYLAVSGSEQKAIAAINDGGDVESTVEEVAADGMVQGFLLGVQFAGGDVGMINLLPPVVKKAIEDVLNGRKTKSASTTETPKRRARKNSATPERPAVDPATL